MAFVLCKNPRTRNVLPQARVTHDGHLLINKAGIQKYRFDDHKFMKLWWDKDKGFIGIELCDKKDFGIVGITKNHVYSFKGFFKYFELDHKDFIGTYDVNKDEDHAFVIIDLNTKQ